MVISRTFFECEMCQNSYDHLEDAQQCEGQPVPELNRLPVGACVKLDARGLKEGPKYVLARVVGYKLQGERSSYNRSIARHRWLVLLDRFVHLVETWGEGGSDHMENIVSESFILPEDLAKVSNKWVDTPLDIARWEDTSYHDSTQYPYQAKAFPSDQPETWVWHG